MSKIQVTNRGVGAVKADVLAVFLFQGQKSPDGVDGELKKVLAARIRKEKFEGRKGEVLRWSATDDAASSALVVGLGEKKSFELEGAREAAGAAATRAEDEWGRSLAMALPGAGALKVDLAAHVQATLEGALMASYRFDRYVNEARRKARPVGALTLSVPGAAASVRRVTARAKAVAEGVALARDLVNEPAIVLNPVEMEKRARKVAREKGLKITVLGPAQLKKEKMGAYLAVAQGSANPPRLVHLIYKPQGKPRGRVALVGKGLTFDSGGLDLKPADYMLDMKCDMGGSAAVLGTLAVLPDLHPRVEVHGFLAMAENMPSAGSYRPGDVLVTRAGKTVEVNNTDAEGRLVLADALAYAQKFKPDSIIDLATLTGACVVALGPLCTGVMGNDPAMIEAVLDAAAASGEKMWPLPLYEEYLDQLKSSVADMQNTGGRYGGALTAGLFLKEFVDEKVCWVHLDIAGPAFVGKDLPYARKGGTGAGVRTLLEYLGRR